MSWKIKQKLRAILANEHGAMLKEWGGKTSIALVYPNTYSIGMGNLAVHTLYQIFNSRKDIVCERAFLPERSDIRLHLAGRTPILSIESQRPLAEFDIVAFTISFENDYLNILPILELSKIAHLCELRGDEAPILIAGGAAPTLNPRPIEKIFDAIFLGEAECYMDDIISAITAGLSKEDIRTALLSMHGVYAQGRTEKRHVRSLDNWKTQTVVHTEGAEFGNMHLIEVQRGCPHRCLFCATPIIYAPPRRRGYKAVLSMVEEGLKHRTKFGLIGADILNHPDFTDIAEAIHKRGATFRPSSVRADAVNERCAKLLAASGHQSVALGVETGNESLRLKAGKKISDETILGACEILSRAGIAVIRLYFMIGLPGETDDDLRAIVNLAGHAQRAGGKLKTRGTKIELTITPFVPKPGTPWGDEEFAGKTELVRKIKTIRRLLGKEKGLRVRFDSPRSAAVESFLASSGPDAINFLEENNWLRRQPSASTSKLLSL